MSHSYELPSVVHALLTTDDANMFFAAFTERLEARYHEVGFSGLTAAERVCYLVCHLERDLRRGGFETYFSSAESHYAHMGPAALRAVGAVRSAYIATDALVQFGLVDPADEVGPDANDTIRALQVAAVPAPGRARWKTLSKVYLEFDVAMDRLRRVQEYVVRHATEFR